MEPLAPIFERRALVRSVHIPAQHIQRNIQVSLMAQLRAKYEGVCIPEGFVQSRSITVVDHSLGRVNLIHGGLDYSVKFQGDICMPHPGQVFRAPVVLRSKIGIHAEVSPMKVLLPRDLHLGDASFEDIKEGQEVEFEVKGSRFQQGDDSIVVLGHLKQVVNAQKAEAEKAVASEEPLLAASTSNAAADVERKVVVPQEQVPVAPRKRRVIAKPAVTTNEPSAQGKAPGPAGPPGPA
jgi:DNA-directed RNA polymerase subunit E'/Rpb7